MSTVNSDTSRAPTSSEMVVLPTTVFVIHFPEDVHICERHILARKPWRVEGQLMSSMVDMLRRILSCSGSYETLGGINASVRMRKGDIPSAVRRKARIRLGHC